MFQQEIEIPNEQHTLHAPPENDDAPIDNPPTTDSHIIEQTSPVTEPSSIDQASTEAQHGSISPKIQDDRQRSLPRRQHVLERVKNNA